MAVEKPSTRVVDKEKAPQLVTDAQGVPGETLTNQMAAPVRTLSTASSESDAEKATEKAAPTNSDPRGYTYKTIVSKPRAWYSKIPFVPTEAPPPPGSLSDARLIPLATAGWFSQLTFQWISPLMTTGYARTLEPADLWKLNEKQSSEYFASRIDKSFERRVREAVEYNAELDRGEISPSRLKRAWWTVRGGRVEREKLWREKAGRRRANLLWALNDALNPIFWTGITIKAFADVAQICSPLIVKAIITFSSESYLYYKGLSKTPPPNIGKGIGMSFGLVALMLFTSLATNQAMYRLASSGVYIRGGLIASIFDRSLRLSNKARSAISNGKLIAHISTDVSRIDFALAFSIGATAPIQIILCLVLLLINLGWSALPGFGLFLIVTPLQTLAIKQLFKFRKAAMVWTDKRSKLLQELLGGIRVIKYFAWEAPFLARIDEFRRREIKYVRSLLIVRSAVNAVAFSLPVFAAIISFVTYSLSGHDLNPAIIFTSLTFFQLLRMPLMLLPVTLGAGTDAYNAIQRLQAFYEAELQAGSKDIDPSLPVAIRVEHADFTWDAPPPAAPTGKDMKLKGVQPAPQAGTASSEPEEKIFNLHDINLEIPRGQLVAIVGAVGSGKSSLLQALIGEMRPTSGKVTFGGPVAYCPQIAWIQSNSIRDNILFGLPFEEERYWAVIRDAELEADLAILPSGDLTEVGERGISLSGGQKQRINIARALYCNSGITIFDDPLSALDAHVGKAVFHQVIQTALAGTTRVLVTHALHFLPSVDYIITMDGATGTIGERGTYDELISRDGVFSKFIAEFGGAEEEEEKREEEEDAIELADAKKKKTPNRSAVAGADLMQQEERETGAVKGDVYRAYFGSGYGKILVPLLIFSLVLTQGANVMNSYWLVYWQEKHWHYRNGFYMGVYGGLGAAQAFSTFLMGFCFTMINYFSAKRLHGAALHRIMHAPMSFFDTTPLGRIMNRFTKDIDTLDNLIADAFRMLSGTLGQIISTIILVSVILPWFLIPVAVILLFYYWGSVFYRASARELKRLDALLRSSLYAHYAESLTGLSTIRAYGESDRFLADNRQRVDTENRAYFLTVVNQRWLGIRLDFLGASLTFFVALLAVVSRDKVSPSQTGVVLSYMLVVQQAFGWFVRQIAEVENDSNAIERILHYSKGIEVEAPHQLPDRKPPNWPSGGQLVFKDVQLSYRPGLPTVLKNVSFSIEAGESIGIVGRSGAGKSSIMVALYRLAELKSGTISIDGVDISTLGLDDLRKNLAIIPQDPLLFSGTIRTNLDPFGQYDDAMLWDALKRAHLVAQNSKRSTMEANRDSVTVEDQSAGRFTLDTVIEEEGANLSVGQRSLVSLARAIVIPATITLLDEATASVDYATDQLIQETIAREFRDHTLLCIAHRLRTVLGYDRICVMSEGQISEFDTPMKLYGKVDGIFRSMCDRSGITEKDVRGAREDL